MAFQRTIISQILQEVKQYNFKKFVNRHKGDHKVSKVTCFNLLIAHLKTNKTLRDITFSFESAQCSHHHLGVKSMKRSTISDSLKNRPAQVYEEFYYEIIKSLNRSERRKLGTKFNLIDSTTIRLCIEKFDWAKYRKKRVV